MTDHLRPSIDDPEQSINLVVGSTRRVFRVTVLLLSKQPESTLWRAVHPLLLGGQPDAFLRFPGAREEYFQNVLDIIDGKDTWWYLKTRCRFFELVSQLRGLNITGTARLIHEHERQQQEEKRQRFELLTEVYCIGLAEPFLPPSVRFRPIQIINADQISKYGYSLYRYELYFVCSRHVELDQAIVSEVIHDLNILTYGADGLDDDSTIPVPWPSPSVDVSITWPKKLRVDQRPVMQMAAQIRERYPTVKVWLALCVDSTDRVCIRVQPRNGDTREQSFVSCCLEYDLQPLDDDSSYMHHKTCIDIDM
jgi:hypothetical protein